MSLWFLLQIHSIAVKYVLSQLFPTFSPIFVLQNNMVSQDRRLTLIQTFELIHQYLIDRLELRPPLQARKCNSMLTPI